MAVPRRIYVSRLLRMTLSDVEGLPVGPITDLVFAPAGAHYPPYLIGYVVSVQRRSIFVNANRVSETLDMGVRLVSGNIDVRKFRLRSGEVSLRNDVLDKRITANNAGGAVLDVALQPDPSEPESWEVAAVVVATPGLLRRRRASVEIPWGEVNGQLFDVGQIARDLSEMRELHPSEAARNIVNLTPERRRELTDALEDQELAEVLEELPEGEQVKLIEELELNRAADVIEEMNADDAVDLLAELPANEREEILEAMEPEDSIPLRRLLSYDGATAGGIMTPEPIVLGPTATIAEALARLRNSEVKAIDAASVYVTEAPHTAPTGRYLGVIGFQRLLREAPSTTLVNCVSSDPMPVLPHTSRYEVARRLASRDITGLPVCDEHGHLLGAVTVDDILDHILPKDWRGR